MPQKTPCPDCGSYNSAHADECNNCDFKFGNAQDFGEEFCEYVYGQTVSKCVHMGCNKPGHFSSNPADRQWMCKEHYFNAPRTKNESEKKKLLVEKMFTENMKKLGRNYHGKLLETA